MATVVITFFLFARFYVYKMDADWIESQRDQYLSRREKRWSMNSQRLEEIVAELMKPISDDGRRSFDTDLSALLEEYLTEAGLHALDAAEAARDDRDEGDDEVVVPNFAEIALLLQQSANIYGRKVDFLYRHVLQVSETLENSVQELANTSTPDEPQTPTTSRRKRKASTSLGDFAEISLEPCAAASREPEAPRPPPTLPRMYIELEPRVVCAADTPLYDYACENIGLLTDFQVAWRLHDGLLVDELEGGAARGASTLRPLSLLELQAAIAAHAPDPLPPHLTPTRDPSPQPICASTPLPPGDDDADGVKPTPACGSTATGGVRRERKRRSDVRLDDVFHGDVKIVFDKGLMKKLKKIREFNLPEKWISDVVEKRKSQILRARKSRHDLQPPDECEADFPGWSSTEAALALEVITARHSELDSDDDGFFEQSSGGGDETERDSLRSDDSALAHAPIVPVVPLVPPVNEPKEDKEETEEEKAAKKAAAEAEAWRDAILQRAVAAEARGGVDVRALGARLLGGLEGARTVPRSFEALLSEHARHPADVARLMLTALFLANAGNVEIVQGPPLSLNSFSMQLLSSEQRLYTLAAAADEQFLR